MVQGRQAHYLEERRRVKKVSVPEDDVSPSPHVLCATFVTSLSLTFLWYPVSLFTTTCPGDLSSPAWLDSVLSHLFLRIHNCSFSVSSESSIDVFFMLLWKSIIVLVNSASRFSDVVSRINSIPYEYVCVCVCVCVHMFVCCMLI